MRYDSCEYELVMKFNLSLIARQHNIRAYITTVQDLLYKFFPYLLTFSTTIKHKKKKKKKKKKRKESIRPYLARMVFLMTVILAIVSFAPSLIGTHYPTKDLEWMTGPNEPLAWPAATASAPPSTYFEVNPTKDIHDSTINFPPIVDSTTEKPEPGIHTGFFFVIILPVFAFVAAISGEARIMNVKAVRSYHLERRARLDLEYKLAQAEDEKAQLGTQLLEMEQTVRVKEEQRKEAVEEANDLRAKLAESAHKESLLQKDLALSKENINRLQATVAKKGKEALEYRAQAYRTTRELPPTHMSRLRFGSGQNPAPPIPHHHTHAAFGDQTNYARSTESGIDDERRNLIGGGGSGTGESSVGKRPADGGNVLRYAPTSW